MNYQIIYVRRRNINEADYLRFGVSVGKLRQPPGFKVSIERGSIMAARVSDGVGAEGQGDPLRPAENRFNALIVLSKSNGLRAKC